MEWINALAENLDVPEANRRASKRDHNGAVISSSAGAFDGVWAAAELRKVLGAMGARVVEAELSVGHAHEKLDDRGELADDDVRAGLAEALQTLLAEVSPVSVAA